MVPNSSVSHPLRHPSAVEVRELDAIARELLEQAACLGHAHSRFRGYSLLAVRTGFGGCRKTHVDLYFRQEGGRAPMTICSRGTVPALSGHQSPTSYIF